jgi:hypothetical protein
LTWNYRVVCYRDQGGFGLHEVYYDGDGKPDGMTADPMVACDVDEGPEGIRKSLELALGDVATRPILDEAETWPKSDS